MWARSVSPALLSLVLSAIPLAAQQASPPPAAATKAAPPAAAASAEEPKLIFDREVFTYPEGRRDPFNAPASNESGPRFESLALRGIIYSRAGRSLVILSDGSRMYRRHQGEMIGNARVVGILPTRVIFSVDNFGNWRQESLQLKKNPEGAKG